MKIGGVQKLSLIDYPGKTSAVFFTVGCNMRCGYCHNPELVLPEQYIESIPEEEILLFLKTRVGKLQGIVISGGEPTVQPDLIEFIRKVKNLGFAIKLDSNGTNPEVLKQIFNKRLIDFIAMDIKGPLDKYQTIVARPIDTETVQKSIAFIKQSGVDYEFRTTVVKSQITWDDFDKIGQLIQGAPRYALQKFRPGQTLKSQFSHEETYTDEEFEQLKHRMERYVGLCVVH
jgi:pyruvate formate lyase activating enzyme